MAKPRTPRNQVRALPEYGELISTMQGETASILTDYIRQYVGIASQTPEPGQGIFVNWDRVLQSQSYQELAWYELYQEVERDPHVLAVMQSAKLNVAGTLWDIDPYLNPGEKKASRRNQAVADFVRRVLNGTGHFPQHLFNMMSALGMGFSVSEIVWKVTDEGIVPANIIHRPQRRFQFDAVNRSLKLRDIKAPYYGTPLPANKFIVHRVSAMWDNPFGDALDQTLYWMWLFKKTVIKFWMQHLNVAAASVPIVKHPASANATAKAEALAIAQMIRNGAYGRLPDNFELIWAEATNNASSAAAYDQFIRVVNDEIAKAVQGQTLTTEASSATGTGTKALGEVHQLTQNSRDVFRARGLESTLNGSLIPWTVDFNFADVDGYPVFRFDLEDPADMTKEADIVQKLSSAGYDFDAMELSERFNWTITKAGTGLVDGEDKPDTGEKDIDKSDVEPVTGADAIQDTALNGAQVTALVDVILKVSNGEIPADSAKEICAASFPSMTPEDIAALVDPAAARAKSKPKPKLNVIQTGEPIEGTDDAEGEMDAA